MAVEDCIKKVIFHDSEDDEPPIVFKRSNTASKQGQSSSAPKKVSSQKRDGSVGRAAPDKRALDGETSNLQGKMAVEDCVKKVLFHDSEDDEPPIVFKRSNTASKQGQSSSAPKKVSSQKSDGSVGRAAPDKRALNGETSNLQKAKLALTTKSSSEKSLAVSKVSLASQSRHSSETRLPTGDREISPLDRSCGGPVNSDAAKPLSIATTRVAQKSNMHEMEVLGTPITTLSPANKIEEYVNNCSDGSEGEKPLALRFQSKSTVGASVKKPAESEEKSLLSSRTLVSPMHMSSTLQIKESIKNDPDDSDDDKPIFSRFQSKSGSGGPSKKLSSTPQIKASIKNDPDDSIDDKLWISRFQSKSGSGATSKKLSDSNNEKHFTSKLKSNGSGTSNSLNKRPLGGSNNSTDPSLKKAKVSDTSVTVKVKHESVVKKEQKADDDDDHIPIAQRMKKLSSSDKQSPIKKVAKVISKKEHKKTKKQMKISKLSKTMIVPPGSGGGQKWTTLEHSGVIFPPPYKPHGVKMRYNGQPVDLTPEQEEVATMFAVMKDTDYASKPKFIENFMTDWRQVLGKNHVIKKYELCDFTPIYEWHLEEKEKKKQMSTEEKKALKEEKMKLEEKYMWAIVDGVKEKVGNFRVEPPGLFRGRGEHPKMGKLKRRIRPRDITINIGKDAPVPVCPIPGERWKEIRHDNTVTWLAFWNDPINQKEFKYVFLAASSSLKGQSDKEKYEKARLLKNYIHNIRANYTRDFSSKDATKRQIAVATYLIDRLALRAGNEKDDDEADTVGCCTLKVENVMLVPPNEIQFDFLGKDSIRYFNKVEVEPGVYKAIGDFRTARKSGGEKKVDGDDLFDMLDTSKLNAHLKELMPGLTAKVFRTYNASITLDEMLNKETKGGTLPEKIAVYQSANKEVAIICNHQRSVSKSHDAQMSRLNEKINELKAQREEFKVDLSRARKGKPPLKDAEGKTKKNLSSEVLEKKLAQVDAKIDKIEFDKRSKEDLKTVALGTSKINYLDPRITVAWCKRHEVPIEKIFNKSLLAKFSWAMDVDIDFRF